MKCVVGIGELLWDVFPAGRRMGGAPANFAWHCRQLGADGRVVTALGEDELGKDLLESVTRLGLCAKWIHRDTDHATGTVQVTLDKQGHPSYEIQQPVAWDFIQPQAALDVAARSTDAVCFGSLAQRGAVSRTTIQRFVSQIPSQALKIFDINLRQNFFSQAIVEESLKLANVLKLSDEELPAVAGYFALTGAPVEQLRQLTGRFDLRLVAYTRSRDGALLLTPDEISDYPGCKADVIDTVGAAIRSPLRFVWGCFTGTH